MPSASASVILKLYMGLTRAFPGLLERVARNRHRDQGAPLERFQERLGQPTAARPEGVVIWLHAPSVGELNSALALAKALRDATGATLLLTTTTMTAAEVAQARGPVGSLHQFQPIDTPAAVAGFLDHWHPDLALFIEGDLWPRMIATLRDRSIPMALINARASKSRERAPGLARAMLEPMAVITAQSDRTAQGLRDLGLTQVQSLGDLKAAALPPETSPAQLEAYSRAIAHRPVWAAVSTHADDDEAVFDAHRKALETMPDLLLVLMPRHAERGAALETRAKEAGFTVARRARGAPCNPDHQIYLADTMGETGAVYALISPVFLGGSFGPEGGHNPYEPAKLGAFVLHGPKVRNFADAYRLVNDAQGAQQVADAAELTREVLHRVRQEDSETRRSALAAQMAVKEDSVMRSLEVLLPLMP